MAAAVTVRRPFICVVGAVLMCLLSASAAAQSFDPAYRFRVLHTPHFVIYFHQEEDSLAARLASIAEQTWSRLHDSLGQEAPTRTHVILVDQTDLANGWATPLPRDTIALFAAWPAGSDSLKTDDWLELVFTHEFTHILHLARSRGWARIARRVFGRTPFAFPNLFLPTWQVEGLAVYEESAITGEGRMHAGDFRAVVDEAARANRLLPLDRVNGGLTRWPGGEASYAYGLRFHAFLAERYGPETLAALADRTARGFPYFGSLAFKRVYGKSLGALWSEFEASLSNLPSPGPSASVAKRLTHHDYVVSGPRIAPASCPSCSPDIYYSVRNADNLPAIYRVTLGPATSAPPTRVATRFLGSTLGVGRERLYFDQQEATRNAGLYSDLYSLDPSTSRVRRLTEGGRLMDPDLSPDGRTIAAVQLSRPGRRDLVLVRLASPDVVSLIATLIADDETQFNAPRWSPDGTRVVAERQRTGHFPEIVIVDAASGALHVVASDSTTRWATPTWRPDGAAVIAAAAIGEAPFNLYEIELTSGAARQITRTTGGATWPEVTADAASIVYVGYSPSGFDLYSMPYPAASVEPTAQVTAMSGEIPATSGQPFVPLDRTWPAYSPWPTLIPTWWAPILQTSGEQVGIGAITAGTDVLGYHSYAVSATRWTDTRENALTHVPVTDWNVAYTYTRWRPALFADLSRETTFFRQSAASPAQEHELTRQETKLSTGVLFRVLRVRRSQAVFWSFERGHMRIVTDRRDVSVDRGATRVGWSFRSAHEFGYSISPERGLAGGATAEVVRRAFGSAEDDSTVTADLRAYAPGPSPHHVVAFRVAAGRTAGNGVVGRTFRLGGPGPDANPTDFGSRAISLLRGFGTDSFAGTHVALINAEYRFPLIRIERGIGTWPFFVHTLHAALFADTGHAWTTGFAVADMKQAYGAEISAGLVLAYSVPLTVTFGAARTHDGSHGLPDGTSAYGRFGYAF